MTPLKRKSPPLFIGHTMATLYQLHSSMDTLKTTTEQMALTWCEGDSIVLLGSTVAFIDWLKAYLNEDDIAGITSIYGLAEDVNQLSDISVSQLKLSTKLTAVLSDVEWVQMTQSDQFDKVVTIAL